MTINQLKAFCELAETLHYSNTAEKLDISQPSLSRMISSLEEELGTHLFEKGRRNLKLSKQGKLFYSYVSRGLREIQQGVHEVRDIMNPDLGTIDFAYIYALGTSFVPDLVREFLADEKNKQIFFQFYQMNSRDIIRKIREGTCDIGFTSYVENEPLIQYQPLIRQEYVLVTSPDHPLASRKTVSLKDTMPYRYILPLDKTTYIENLFQKAGLTPLVTSRVEEDHAAAALVSTGLGIAILPGNEDLNQYHVKQIPFSPEPFYRRFYLVTAKNRILSPAASAFYQFIMEKIQ